MVSDRPLMRSDEAHHAEVDVGELPVRGDKKVSSVRVRVKEAILQYLEEQADTASERRWRKQVYTTLLACRKVHCTRVSTSRAGSSPIRSSASLSVRRTPSIHSIVRTCDATRTSSECDAEVLVSWMLVECLSLQSV